MKNLIYQYYIPYEAGDADIGGVNMPDWAAAGSRSAKAYNIDYVLQDQPILMITPDPFQTNRSKEATARLGYLPIYEKENAFTYLRSYDQVAIIDSDVYIRPDAPNLMI